MAGFQRAGIGLGLETCREARNLTAVSGGADWRRLRRVLGFLRVGYRVGARVRAEVSRLVHVVPQAIDVNTCRGIEKRRELLIPVLLGVGVEPVREDSWTWPNSTFEERAVLALLEYIKRNSIVVAVVVTAPNSGVDHHDVMLLVGMNIINELANKIKRVSLWIQSEQTAELHVVNIRPHGLDKISDEESKLSRSAQLTSRGILAAE